MQHVALMPQWEKMHGEGIPCIFSSKLVLVICSLLIAGGCALHNPFHQRETLNDTKMVFINNVPFIKQKPDYCGPATLAMIFNFWGMHITQDEIAQEVYSPGLKGTLSIEMVLYTIEKGFEAEIYDGSFQDIKDKLTLGLPLIVSHRTNKGDETVHYLIILGFNDNNKIVYVHSGEKENQVIDYQTFLERWNLANNLIFFIHPRNKNFEVPYES